MLNKSACRSAWYGEVYRDKTNLGPGTTEMGSGNFADAGLFAAAHVRNPKYYDLVWFSAGPDSKLSITPMMSKCYSRSDLIDIGPPWDSVFLFLGGSGGTNPECVWS